MAVKLTDRQQAVVMFLVLMIPALLLWINAEMPMDRAGLSLLLYGLLSGFLAGLKELAGWKES